MRDVAKRVYDRLDGLLPEPKRKCLLFLALAGDQGIPCRVTETSRTMEVEIAYYAQGRQSSDQIKLLRERAGLAPLKFWQYSKIITYARPGTSNHGKGIAFDVAIMRWDQKLIPDWASPHWPRLGEIAKVVGLSWGGNWTKPDRPHFEDLS